MGSLRISEWIALLYFAYLAAVAGTVRVSVERRRSVIATASLVGGCIAILALETSPAASVARDWLPLLELGIGYWLPARLVARTDPRLEQVLLSLDRRLFGHDGLERFRRRAPRALLEYLELAYLLCYALVPLAFGWVVLAGFRSDADRFWSTVLAAGFGCYGLLPWLPARPPRAIEAPAESRSVIRRLNMLVLDRASIQLNTFPSGHTAASFAAALAVCGQMPWVGLALGFLAISIAAGSIVGRYHYAADAGAGSLLAVTAFAGVRILSG